MSEAMNDDTYPPPVTAPINPNAHGQAALILVESLIHGLLTRSTLMLHEAIEIVQSAVDVQCELSEDRGDDPTVVPTPRHLLSSILDSLSRDGDGNSA